MRVIKRIIAKYSKYKSLSI